jgi:hypothetical protein
MPERKFDGKCNDCGQEFKDLTLVWEGGQPIFDCRLVEWLIATTLTNQPPLVIGWYCTMENMRWGG